MDIFVIDKAAKQNLGALDFIPKKDERIVLEGNRREDIECIVSCILYVPKEHAILVFVDIVEPYYSAMISEIKWSSWRLL